MGRICCIFYTEDGSSRFFQHVGTHPPNCMASHPRTLTAVTTSYLVGFEVLTAMVMKSTIFWDITLCNPLKVN
jgi:hypothetical protein